MVLIQQQTLCELILSSDDCWWAKEFEALKASHQKEEGKDTEAALKLVTEQGERFKDKQSIFALYWLHYDFLQAIRLPKLSC